MDYGRLTSHSIFTIGSEAEQFTRKQKLVKVSTPWQPSSLSNWTIQFHSLLGLRTLCLHWNFKTHTIHLTRTLEGQYNKNNYNLQYSWTFYIRTRYSNGYTHTHTLMYTEVKHRTPLYQDKILYSGNNSIVQEICRCVRKHSIIYNSFSIQ